MAITLSPGLRQEEAQGHAQRPKRSAPMTKDQKGDDEGSEGRSGGYALI